MSKELWDTLYAFLKTLPHHKVDRIMCSEPESWDAIIDNLMKEQGA